MIELLGNTVFVLCMSIVAAGLLGALLKRNLLKIVIGLHVIDTGINLFIISLGYKEGGTAPIFTGLETAAAMVDPIPQALTLTSIVISACVTALALSIAMKVFKHTGTLDADEVGKNAGVSG